LPAQAFLVRLSQRPTLWLSCGPHLFANYLFARLGAESSKSPARNKAAAATGFSTIPQLKSKTTPNTQE